MLDFENSPDLVETAYLVTIVSEAVLKDSLVMLLKNLHVKSYSVSQIQGEDRVAHPLKTTSSPESGTSVETTIETTVEIRTIVSQELSNVIFYTLKDHQRDFAITAYRQKVEMLSTD